MDDEVLNSWPSRLEINPSAAHELLCQIRGNNEAVRAVGRWLMHASTNVRERTAWVLSELGSGAAPAIDGLMQGLTDSSPQVRYYCSECFIFDLGPGTERGLCRLFLLLDDEDEHVRRKVLYVLSHVAEPRWTDALRACSDHAIEKTLPIQEVLVLSTESVPNFRVLHEASRAPRAGIRLAALIAGYRSGPKGIGFLIEGAMSPDAELQSLSLELLGDSFHQVTDALHSALNAPVVPVRNAALVCAAAIGKATRLVHRDLHACLDPQLGHTRVLGLYALRDLRAMDAKSFETVAELVYDSNLDVSDTAGQILGDMDLLSSLYNTPSATAVDNCVRIALDADVTIHNRSNALMALSIFTPVLGAERNGRLWNHMSCLLESQDLRSETLRVLSRMPLESIPETSFVVPYLNDEDVDTRRQACKVLARRPASSHSALVTLSKMLDAETSHRVRFHAAEAMLAICPSDSRALQVVHELGSEKCEIGKAEK
jgi:hypothetical protein